MSVIVTGMDMPVKCGACSGAQYFACKEWLSVGRDSIKRSRTCPLKSVEGLIKELKQDIDDNPDASLGEYRTGLYRAIEIVKEYCKEVEE